MKTILAIFTILLTVPAAYTVAETNVYIFDIAEHWRRVDALFESHIPRILAKEREKAEATMPADTVDSYMEYFERGIRSNTGGIMLTGRDIRRLEIAYREGFARKALFRLGYSAGLARKAETNQDNNASNHH